MDRQAVANRPIMFDQSNPYHDEASSEHLPIVDIFLETRIEDIPEAPLCEVGHWTDKAFLEHVVVGAHVAVRAANAAGYRCPNEACGLEYYSHEALAESLIKARQIMLEAGDHATADAFQTAIDRHQQIIATQRRTMPRQMLSGR